MSRGMTVAQLTVLNLLVRRPTAVAGDPADGRAKRVALTQAGRAMRETCSAATAPGPGALRAVLDADRDPTPRPAPPQNGNSASKNCWPQRGCWTSVIWPRPP